MMNRFLVAILIVINVCLLLYLWLNWKSFHDFQNRETAPQEWKSSDRDQSIPNDLQDRVFVPTNEWKPLGRDQPIPKGLHVRINLQTGAREAKLLVVEEEDVDDEKKSLIPIIDESEIHIENEDADKWEYEVLKESLKNIKNEANKDADAINKNDQPKTKFRTYEKIKEELSDMKMVIKTDMEVLNDFLKEFHTKYIKTGKMCSEGEPELEAILKNLENLLHQVDNAEEFSKRNGIHEIVLPCLSSNSTSMRTLSARVLGAAVQNNPKVQIEALRVGVIAPLLRTVALTKDHDARASSIFALSCLVRSFPFAEVTLIKEGGLDVLLSLFEETSADALKLQLKVVSLFDDLIMEREDAEQTIEEEKSRHNVTVTNETFLKEIQQMQERLKQYNGIDLKTKLIERGWCSKLSHVLSTRIPNADFVLASDVEEHSVNHDMVDKVIKAMTPFVAECQQQLTDEKGLVQILKNLSRYYERLITEDEYYKDMYKTVQKLNSKLHIS